LLEHSPNTVNGYGRPIGKPASEEALNGDAAFIAKALGDHRTCPGEMTLPGGTRIRVFPGRVSTRPWSGEQQPELDTILKVVTALD